MPSAPRQIPRLSTPLPVKLVIPQRCCCGLRHDHLTEIVVVNLTSTTPHQNEWHTEEAAIVFRGLFPLMDTWTARKRPWEESSPIDVPLKRRDSTGDTPSLPQHADHYPHDGQSLSQRRLPPLYTSSYVPPTAFHASSSLQLSSLTHEAVELDNSRPRSQSLFDIFQSPKRLRRDSDFGKNSSCIRSSLSCLAATLVTSC